MKNTKTPPPHKKINGFVCETIAVWTLANKSEATSARAVSISLETRPWGEFYYVSITGSWGRFGSTGTFNTLREAKRACRKECGVTGGPRFKWTRTATLKIIEKTVDAVK